MPHRVIVMDLFINDSTMWNVRYLEEFTFLANKSSAPTVTHTLPYSDRVCWAVAGDESLDCLVYQSPVIFPYSAWRTNVALCKQVRRVHEDCFACILEKLWVSKNRQRKNKKSFNSGKWTKSPRTAFCMCQEEASVAATQFLRAVAVLPARAGKEGCWSVKGLKKSRQVLKGSRKHVSVKGKENVYSP